MAKHLGMPRAGSAVASHDYRASHQSAGYGERYEKTFRTGYYAALWSRIEKPLVERVLLPLGGPDRNCLDFACGTGRITNLAARYFGEVVGVDVSRPMLDIAQVPGNARLLLADITHDPLPEKFDAVTAFRFFLNAEDALRKDALSALRENLKEGGLLISNVQMNATSPIGLVCRVVNRLAGRTIHCTLSIDEYADLLAANGFRVERTIGYGFLPRPGHLLPRLCELAMEPFEKLCGTVGLPDRFAQNFLVVARKG